MPKDIIMKFSDRGLSRVTLILAVVGVLGCSDGGPTVASPEPFFGILPAFPDPMVVGETWHAFWSARPGGFFDDEVTCNPVTWTASNSSVLQLVIEPPQGVAVTALEVGTSTLTVSAVCPPPIGSRTESIQLTVALSQ